MRHAIASCDGGSLVYVAKELLDRINRIHRISAVNFKDFVHSVSIIRFFVAAAVSAANPSTLNSQLLHACFHSTLSYQLRKGAWLPRSFYALNFLVSPLDPRLPQCRNYLVPH